MSQLRVFGFVIFTLITVVACGGQNGSAELTDNQKNLVAERLPPHGSVVMAGQARLSTRASCVGRTGDFSSATNRHACIN